MFYNCLKVVTSLQSTPDVALHRRVFGTCCYKESMNCSKSSPYTFLYANQQLSITRCQRSFTWQIEWIAVSEILWTYPKKKIDAVRLQYWVNSLLRGNNWNWKKCTTLSWDWISYKSLLPINHSMHSRCMRKLVLNRDIAWKSFWNGMERWMNFQWKHPPIFQTFRVTNDKRFEQQSGRYWKRITSNSSHSFSVKDTSLRDDTSDANLEEWYFWHTGCAILQSGI